MESITEYLNKHGFGYIKIDRNRIQEISQILFGDISDQINMYSTIRCYVEGNHHVMIDHLEKLMEYECKTLLDNDRMLELLKNISFEKRHAKVTYMLARYYQDVDNTQMINYYLKAADYGSVVSMIYLGRRFLETAIEMNVIELYDIAMNYFRKAKTQCEPNMFKQIEIKIIFAMAVWYDNDVDNEMKLNEYMDVESLEKIGDECVWYSKYDELYCKKAINYYENAEILYNESNDENKESKLKILEFKKSIIAKFCTMRPVMMNEHDGDELLKEAIILRNQAEKKYNKAMEKYAVAKKGYQSFAPHKLDDIETKITLAETLFYN